jgi:signal peptidase II
LHVPRKFAVPALAAGGLTLADQISKAWVVSRFEPYEAKAVLANFLHVVHARNTGAAFGLLSRLNPEWVQPLLVATTVFAMVAILAYIHFLPRRGPAPFGLGLILGGAIGNLIDRARLGYVVDFLDVHWYNHHWPAFNVADIGITVGVFLLILDMLYWSKEEGNTTHPS